MHVLLFSHELGSTGHTGGFRWDGLIRELLPRGFTFDVVTSAQGEAARTRRPDGGYGEGVHLHPVSSDWAGRRARAWVQTRRPAPAPLDAGEAAVAASGPAPEPAVMRADAELPPAARAAAAIWGAYHSLEDGVWVRRAARAGDAAAASRRPDVVVATLPEWLVPLAARRVARRHGLPLILDLRDPWMFGRGVHSAMIDDVRRRVWRRAEISATRDAALVIDNTDAARLAAQAEIAPFASTPRVTVTNAHPGGPVAAAPDRGRFTVSFVGWLYPFMDPRPLLQACGRMRRRHGLDGGTMAVRFVGTGPAFGGVALDQLAAEAGLAGVFEATGRVPRPEASRIMESSAVLAILDFPHGLQTPSKFYHYAQMRGRILPIAAPGGSLYEAAARLGIAASAPGDADALDAALDDAFRTWRLGNFPSTNDPDGLFRWPRVANQMADGLRRAAATGRRS